MPLTDAQKIAAFDALIAAMEGKRQTRATHDRTSAHYRQVPVYEWTIRSGRCDLAGALMELVPKVEPGRAWPKRKRAAAQVHAAYCYEYGYPV